MGQHGVTVAEPHRGAGATANFASVTGREEDLVAQLARLTDLTVVPHPEAGEDVSSSDALHAVLFDSGRPVLIAPQAAAADDRHADLHRLERHGRERRRGAGGDALDAAGAMRCGSCPPTSTSAAARGAMELASYLALHGIECETAQFRPVERDVGRGLLEGAREFGADMLAMGAYSHSRLRQLILGGVTRHVLEHSKIPVLMNR